MELPDALLAVQYKLLIHHQILSEQRQSIDVYPLDVNATGPIVQFDCLGVGRVLFRLQSALIGTGFIRSDVILRKQLLENSTDKDAQVSENETKKVVSLTLASKVEINGTPTKSSRCDGTVGFEFLRDQKCVIDYNDMELRFGNKRYLSQLCYVVCMGSGVDAVIILISGCIICISQ